MQLTDYLQVERGRAAALARAIGVRATQIGKWVSGDRPVPEKRCVQIEQATAGLVSRKDLRQDWPEIWPELVPPQSGPEQEREGEAAAM